MFEKILIWILTFFGYNPDYIKMTKSLSPQEVGYLDNIRVNGPPVPIMAVEKSPLVELLNAYKEDVDKVTVGNFRIDFACWLLEVDHDELEAFFDLYPKIKKLIKQLPDNDLEILVNSPKITLLRMMKVIPSEMFEAQRLSSKPDPEDKNALLLNRLGLAKFTLPEIREIMYSAKKDTLLKLASLDIEYIDLMIKVTEGLDEVTEYATNETEHYKNLVNRLISTSDNLYKSAQYGMERHTKQEIEKAMRFLTAMHFIAEYELKADKVIEMFEDKEENKIKIVDMVRRPHPPRRSYYLIQPLGSRDLNPYIMQENLLQYNSAKHHTFSVPSYLQHDGVRLHFKNAHVIRTARIFESNYTNEVGRYVGTYAVKHFPVPESVTLTKEPWYSQSSVLYAKIDMSKVAHITGSVVVTKKEIDLIGTSNLFLLYDSETQMYLGEYLSEPATRYGDFPVLTPTSSDREYSINRLEQLRSVKSSETFRALSEHGICDGCKIYTYNDHLDDLGTTVWECNTGQLSALVTGDLTKELKLEDNFLYQELIGSLKPDQRVSLTINNVDVGRFTAESTNESTQVHSITLVREKDLCSDNSAALNMANVDPIVYSSHPQHPRTEVIHLPVVTEKPIERKVNKKEYESQTIV